MAIGENIQAYRKALGISQEELGQRLLVSRQTISLWEKGQTLPTVDNLIQLKEIFGVSADAILDTESNSVTEKTAFAAKPIPTESYTLSFTEEELRKIRKENSKPLYRKGILFFIYCILWILTSLWYTAPDSIMIFAASIFWVGTIGYGKRIFEHRKIWKQWQARASGTVYEYKIYESHLCASLYRSNEKIRESKHYFQDIEFIQSIGSFLSICISGQLYYIRKSDLAENSFFYAYLYRNPSKIQKAPNADKWQIIANLLFVASLCTLPLGVPLVASLSTAETFEQNMWILYLLTPIPIASIIAGYMLKPKGCKYKKNIIAGIIMTVLLCIYGSFTFIT